MSGERLALWWVDRYTRGLPDAEREARRAEIASDVWEHRAAAGAAPGVQLATASRCLRGVPADLSWRRSRTRGRRALPGRGALLRGAGWAVAGASYAALVAQHSWFATALLGLDLYGADWASGDVEATARLGGGFLVLLVAGAVGLWRAPRLGAASLVAASVGTAGLMWWFLPVVGPMAVSVSSAAVVLARRRRRGLRARAATPAP
jgi:hypothetical protein